MCLSFFPLMPRRLETPKNEIRIAVNNWLFFAPVLKKNWLKL